MNATIRQVNNWQVYQQDQSGWYAKPQPIPYLYGTYPVDYQWRQQNEQITTITGALDSPEPDARPSQPTNDQESLPSRGSVLWEGTKKGLIIAGLITLPLFATQLLLRKGSYLSQLFKGAALQNTVKAAKQSVTDYLPYLTPQQAKPIQKLLKQNNPMKAKEHLEKTVDFKQYTQYQNRFLKAQRDGFTPDTPLLELIQRDGLRPHTKQLFKELGGTAVDAGLFGALMGASLGGFAYDKFKKATPTERSKLGDENAFWDGVKQTGLLKVGLGLLYAMAILLPVSIFVTRGGYRKAIQATGNSFTGTLKGAAHSASYAGQTLAPYLLQPLPLIKLGILPLAGGIVGQQIHQKLNKDRQSMNQPSINENIISASTASSPST